MTIKNITVQHYKVTLIIKLVFIFVGYMLAFFALSCGYYIFLHRYNREMENFHLFLTTYRQTPRSRFIRKYQPSLEPLYEENSIFERSLVTTEPDNQSRIHGDSRVHDSRVHDSKVMVGNRSGADLTSLYNQTLRASLHHGLSQMINFDEETQLFIEEFDTGGVVQIDTDEAVEQGKEDNMILDKLFTQSFN